MKLLLPPSRTVRGTAEQFAPLDRYTGTLYKALDIGSLTAAERRYAEATLVIHDKELGLQGGLGGAMIVDARSGEYQRLIKAPAAAWRLRVVSEGEDGRRLAISHWNKHHKGVLAAALVRARPRIRRIEELLGWAEAAGFRLEVVGDRSLDFVV